MLRKRFIKIILSGYLIFGGGYCFGGIKGHKNFIDNISGFFSENRGQLPQKDILYYGSSNGARVYCTSSGIRIAFITAQDTNLNATMEAAEMELQGALPNVKVQAEEILPGYSNYYYPSCPEGLLYIPHVKKIVYSNVYPSIDMEIQLMAKGLKYSFVVHPGGKTEDIKLQWKGLRDMHPAPGGGLHYSLAYRDMDESTPVAYTNGNDTIKTSFSVENGITSFTTAPYPANSTLVIDPYIEWATYYGKASGTACLGVTVNDSGKVYVTGGTLSDSGISTPGVFQQSLKGTKTGNMFLAKFDSAGNLLWATYYGSGKGFSTGEQICLDKKNNIYIAGETLDSSGYMASKGGWKTKSNGQQDIFLSRWSPSGQRVWSTYYGGAGKEMLAGMCSDKHGNIYITGNTISDTGIVSKNCLQSSRRISAPFFYSRRYSLFIARFTENGKRAWGTYYGEESVNAYSIICDPSYNVYVSSIMSPYAPGYTTKGAYLDSVPAHTYAHLLMKLDSNCAIKWATYIDTIGSQGNCLYISRHSRLYVSLGDRS